jgi:probable phosphomutase (TIGR03848 family)
VPGKITKQRSNAHAKKHLKAGKKGPAGTEIFLLRHAESVANKQGILAGRIPGILLTEQGEKQACSVAEYLEEIDFDLILSSPLDRCLHTLAPIINRTGKEVFTDNRLLEMNYGSWSGKKLRTLGRTSLWKEIQRHPSSVRFPDGESFMEMLLRVNEVLNEVPQSCSKVLICTHGDIIKALVNHHVGNHLDNFQRLAISTGSISRLYRSSTGWTVRSFNEPTTRDINRKITTELGGGK